MRWIAVAAAVLAALVLVPQGASDPASAVAGHGKRCGIVAKKGRAFRVHTDSMKCRKAKRGVKRYLKKRRPLKRFRCSRGSGHVKFYCSNGRKSYWAKRL